MSASILVVDDEAVFRVLAEEALTAEGFEVRAAETLKKARAEFERGAPDVLILDRRLPDGAGIDFLKELRATEMAAPAGDSSAPIVIVVTAYGEAEKAAEALKAAPWNY